jgi:hypothetical protein
MNLVANFRLGKLLKIYQDYREDYKLVGELRKFHEMAQKDVHDQYEGVLVNKLFEDFEALFDSEENKLLAVNVVSGVWVNIVFCLSLSFF